MDHVIKSREISFNTSDSQKTIKNVLSHKVFVGEYVARRYVDKLNEYRDVIVCDESETDFIQLLKEVQNKIIEEYGLEKWLGITENNETEDQKGYCLWIQSEQMSFGKHWFQVKSLKIKDKEIYLQLIYLRPYQTEEKKICVEGFINFNLKEIITFDNLCEASKFSMVLILTIVTCCLQGGAFLLDFLVKFIHELSLLIQSLTPIMIAIVNALMKCVGGFYWLIFMIMRGNSINASRQPSMFENRNQFAIMDSAINTKSRDRYRNNSQKFTG